MVTLKDILLLIGNPYRVRIIEDGRTVYVGWIGTIMAGEHTEDINLDSKVVGLEIATETRHSKWRDLGLMPPPEPELPHEFESDDQLVMWIYYDIKIEKGEKS